MKPIFLIIYSRRAKWTKHWSLKAGRRMLRPNLPMTSTSDQGPFAVGVRTDTSKTGDTVEWPVYVLGLSQDRHFHQCHKHVFKCRYYSYSLTPNLIYERKHSYSNCVMLLCIFNTSVGGSMRYVTQQDKRQFLWIFISGRLVLEQHDLGKKFS